MEEGEVRQDEPKWGRKKQNRTYMDRKKQNRIKLGKQNGTECSMFGSKMQ